MWGEQKARQMLGEAGFALLDVKRSPLDPVNNYYIASKTGTPGTWADKRDVGSPFPAARAPRR
jgi:hypothetical protein